MPSTDLQVFAQARKYNRAIAFEGSVGGGSRSSSGAGGFRWQPTRCRSLAAIVNGTCNFILTAMTQNGLPYSEARFARPRNSGTPRRIRPSDVDGSDTAHKLAILAQLAFGASVKTAQIAREGIDQPATSAGPQVCGGAWLRDQAPGPGQVVGVGLRVAGCPDPGEEGDRTGRGARPCITRIRVVGDAVGDTFFSGRGAGMMPTASAVVGDLIDVVVGRAALTSRALEPSGPKPPLPLV